MATTFPTDTYPLLQGEAQVDKPKAQRDLANDGTPHVRQMTAAQYRKIPLHFAPLDRTAAESLAGYLSSNPITEFDVTIGTQVYTGYLWSDEVEVTNEDGLWWVVTEFYGKLGS